jgi:hypothetical protein
MKTPMEIRHEGYEALVKALGFVGMLRFMQQFDNGRGNYTEERSQWLDKFTLEDIVAEANRQNADS